MTRNDAASSGKVLMLRHLQERPDNRVALGLRERGYTLDWCCPAEGDSLPSCNDYEYEAVVVFGGSQSVNDNSKTYLRGEMDWIGKWVETGKPFFGICLGAQLLTRALGGEVGPHADGLHEIGYVDIHPTAESNGFLDQSIYVYQWHNEGFSVPKGCTLLATSERYPNQAYLYGDKAYAVQFHPEVTPTIFQTWFEEAGDHLTKPGAHSAERQIADAAVYDEAQERWINDFIDMWLPS